MKKGDKAFLAYDGRDKRISATTVVSVGAKWITIADGRKFSVDAHASGAHYGEFGWSLWPTREAIERAGWARQARIDLADAIRRADFEALRKVADLLGYDAKEAPDADR